ncbi:MAG TPA: sugar transferase [Methylomirabilota bacterium]|nr:sugar transferase [Methylomirabilota bacterium]
MLRRDRQIRTQINQLADAFLVAVSFWFAYILRASPQIAEWMGLEKISGDMLNKDAWLIPLAMISAAFLLESQGFYNRPILCPRRVTLWPLFKGCALTVIVLILTTYVFQKTLIVPRGVTTFFGVISFTLLFAKEELLRLAIKSKFGQSQYKRRFILVGAQAELSRMCHELEGRRDDTVAIIAQFDLAQPLSRLVQLLHEHSIYGIILNAKRTYFEQVENIIKACELEGVEVWLIADFFTTQISRTTFDELLGKPLLIFSTAPEASWQGAVKQCMDFFGAIILLLMTSPLFLLAAMAIKLTSRGPVFFKQQRSGLNGAPFIIYKFRTMVSNAEQFKHELEVMNEMRGPVFKVTNDPRVTGAGKFLRRYSLDELPQLWNVLRGEMSLVGPRPLPVDEVKRFNDFAHRRRLSVKPGLTCLWQVSGRNQISDFKDWVRLDLEYIDNWSLWLDLKILLKTIPAVFIGTGAK